MTSLRARLDDALQRTLPYGPRRTIRRIMQRHRYRQMQALAGRGGDATSLDPALSHRCIFLHIPKTGGISVANALFGGKRGGHRTLRDWQLVVDQAELQSMFTFAFVRNPWDRLLSAYTFLKAGGRNAFDARWAQQNLAGIDNFDAFVRHWLNGRTIWSREHFWPQYWFVQDQPGQIGVDFIGRFEHIERDFNYVRQRLDLPEATLAHHNRGAHAHRAAEAYTPDTARIVADVYRTDIELFEYEAGSPR